jgi:hypothetical protein
MEISQAAEQGRILSIGEEGDLLPRYSGRGLISYGIPGSVSYGIGDKMFIFPTVSRPAQLSTQNLSNGYGWLFLYG